jgi:hypothetical protein
MNIFMMNDFQRDLYIETAYRMNLDITKDETQIENSALKLLFKNQKLFFEEHLIPFCITK